MKKIKNQNISNHFSDHSSPKVSFVCIFIGLLVLTITSIISDSNFQENI